MAALEDIQNLRAAVMRYKQKDDEVRGLNERLYPLREERSIIALEITDILRQPEFATYTKLDIREDGSSIKIKKPGTWNAAWSLSKNKLREYLVLYFHSTGAPTPEGCYRYIHDVHQATLTQQTFSIERVVPE